MTATNERALRHAGHVYIGGKWVKPEQTEPLDVINPATEECVAQVAQAGVADVKRAIAAARTAFDRGDWVRTAPRSEEHTSELQSLMRISYAVFCLNQKNTTS